MPDPELVDSVRRSLAEETLATFERRVDEQAAMLREELAAGRFANRAYSLGLELEAYAVDGEGRLARVPEAVFERAGCNRELGLHNVEVNTDAAAFDAAGVAAQAEGVRQRVAAARGVLKDAGLELVLDGMWTVPPAEGTDAYLSAVERVDGVTVATNMRTTPRYCAIDNDVLARRGGAVDLDLPGVRRSYPTILAESLTASIQPHLQVPDLAAFPRYHAVGIRTLAPVLALATNSPFLPADLYGGGDGGDGPDDRRDTSGDRGDATDDRGDAPDDAGMEDPYDLVDRTYHELRIPVFEQSINAGGDAESGKVRFPRDIERPGDVVDRLVADRTCAPFLKEWVTDADAVDGYADRIWELDHKRGTYWRWLRAVPGGDAVGGVDERSLRLEYRPLPTQPTVDDVVGCQCLVAGLLRGLVAADHPLPTLEWAAARRSFYEVVEAGLEADLAWVDADGERTDDPAVIYRELFEHARLGLREQGLPEAAIDGYLAPIEARWEQRTTPSRWKKDAVRDRLDRGAGLRSAIEGMQREYVERSRSGAPFVRW